MPGMNSGLSPGDPTLVAAFRSALLHQGAIALLMLVLVWLLWGTARAWRSAAAPGEAAATAAGGAAAAEARARWLLRIGFGVLWIFDGLLQAQPKMAGGLATQVIEPVAASSPGWVQHLVNWGGTVWSYHPVQAGAASVWIQVGIGVWLIAAARGPWSRLAGAASVAWGLIVWVFGESFGGIFAPGLSWLTGAPGGVLFYVAAGALIALPEDAWRSPRAGRLLLAGLGVFFTGMAVLQAWPGRGFWQGSAGGKPGTLSGMVKEMAGTPQPRFLSSLLSGFASFATRYGFAVNLFVVIALAAIGAAFLTGRPRLVRYAMWSGIAFCLADWVLVQDLGFLGGLGTDPNSMIPLILLFSAGYLALVPEVTSEMIGTSETTGGRDRVAGSVGVLGEAEGCGRFGAGAVGGGGGGAGGDPARGGADGRGGGEPDGGPDPGPGHLRQQQQPGPPGAGFLAHRPGRPDGVAGQPARQGRADDLPRPGVHHRLPDHRAGVQAGRADARRAGKHVELVAVVANPTYRSTAFTRAFDRQEGLTAVPNWLYLTGSLSQLGAVWRHYGVTVQDLPAGAMAAHNDLAVVIDPAGHIRQEVDADPGPGTSGTQSSFSVLLSQYARQALRQS